MVVYVDVLVVTNYVINFFLLRCCARFSGMAQRRLFTILAALAGAAFSLVIFLPPMPMLMQLVLRLAGALLMVLIAYPGQSLAVTFRLLLVLFIAGFLLAGGCLALWFLLGDQVLIWNNGISYFRLKPITLIASTTAVYGMVWLFARVFRSRKGDCLYIVQAERNHRIIRFEAKEDTGNSLVEPFSGLPVVVCRRSVLEGLLEPEERAWLSSLQVAGAEFPKGCRLVYYRSVGGSGVLGAVRPDRLLLCQGDRTISCEGYLAASDQLDTQTQGLLNPQMLRLRV